MDIILKESKTGWIKVSDTISVLASYYNQEQEIKLKGILYEIGFIPGIDLDNIESLSPENRATVMTLNERYYRLFLKYTIKDWKGVHDKDGQDVPFKLVNDEMDNHLWDMLCRALTLHEVYTLVGMIRKEIEFTEVDKKKFTSPNSSKKKVS